MERINRRRSTGGCIPTSGNSASSSSLLQASSPRLRAAYEESLPARRRAPSPQDRNGLAAAARLAAASSGEHPARSGRLPGSQNCEKNRRLSLVHGSGGSPPPLRHAWRFTAAPANEIPPPPPRSPQSKSRDLAAANPPSPAAQTREPPAAAPSSPIVHERRLRDDGILAHERRLRAPVHEDAHLASERHLTRAATHEDILPLSGRRFSRAPLQEDNSSYAPSFKAPETAKLTSDAAIEVRSFAPSLKAPERALTHSDAILEVRSFVPSFKIAESAALQSDATLEADVARPRLTRAQSVLRTTKAPERARAHSADPRRRRERELSVELVAPAEEIAPAEDLPASHRRSGVVAPLANNGAKTERQSSQLTTASSALSSSLRKPAPFKSLPSNFGGRYQVGRYLGRGASATVWEASHSDSNMRVAVKVFDQGSRDKKQAHRELRVLSRVQHPSVLEAIEVVETSLYSQLVTELLDGESLRAYTQRQPNHRLEESAAQRLYQQVVEGVSFCHERLVVHRDLKLENLLLDKSAERVKIIDFGFASQVATKGTKLRAFCGTPSYMAPEIVKGEAYSGFATDVWALGVVVFALLAGTLPFVARTEMQLYAKIRRGIFNIPDSLGDPVRRLVRAMMRLEGSARPSSTAILRQSWVCGLGASTARKSLVDCHVESHVCLHRDKENLRRLAQTERPDSPAKQRTEFAARRRSMPGTALGGS
mmetsp:Transcript_83059/g.131045  ORF Transcript_83059/g.131045 Transcript_83059/m.131045 type:complete len:712 (-) Transcript_83059:106-2241(-)